jgi:hypothetical protein
LTSEEPSKRIRAALSRTALFSKIEDIDAIAQVSRRTEFAPGEIMRLRVAFESPPVKQYVKCKIATSGHEQNVNHSQEPKK